jgi:hypothetical protein
VSYFPKAFFLETSQFWCRTESTPLAGQAQVRSNALGAGPGSITLYRFGSSLQEQKVQVSESATKWLSAKVRVVLLLEGAASFCMIQRI